MSFEKVSILDEIKANEFEEKPKVITEEPKVLKNSESLPIIRDPYIGFIQAEQR